MSHTLGTHKLHASHSNYQTITREYYKKLTMQQLDNLVEIYKNDFLLFGYKWIKYYQYIM